MTLCIIISSIIEKKLDKININKIHYYSLGMLFLSDLLIF